MERIINKSISIILAITLSFMCIPANAISAFAATNETDQSTSVVDESGTEESSNLFASTQESADDTQVDTSSVTDTVLSTLSSVNNSSDSSLSTTNTSATSTNNEITGYYKAYNNTYEYHYRDSYFTKSSTTYDTSLSTMSFNLAMAAFGSTTGTKDEDYADADSNIKDLMTQLGFTDYECTEDFHKVPSATTIGAAISHKEIIDDTGQKRTLIAVAIRGGNYQQEWSGNATIGTDGEAEGFGIARDKVADLINNYLAAHQDEITECPKFWITGFSRGSAVANLTANYLNYCMENYQNDADVISTDLAEKTRELLKNKKATQEDLFCYGFEVPAGGSSQSKYLCDNYNNIWNIVDPTDLVPLVAPKKWGFYRYGNDIDDTSGVSEDSLKTQLGAISQEALNNYNNLNTSKDGDFRLYKAPIMSVIYAFKGNSISSLPYESKSKSYKADYLNDFINYTADSIGSREDYVSKYQDTISIVAGLMFSGANISKIMDVAKKGVGNTFTGWKIASILGYVAMNPTVFASSTALRRFLSSSILPDCLENAIQALRDDPETRAMIGDAQLDKLENSIDDLTELVLDLVMEDSSFGLDGKISIVPTAFYYKGELISAHNVNTVLAYLRANDSNYTDVSSDGSYSLTYASSDKGGYFNARVSITNDAGEQIAAYDEDGLKSDDSSVRASKNADGSVTFYVAKTDANKKVTFSLCGTSAEASNVYLKYFDYKSPGTSPTESKRAWENQPITINANSTVTLTCTKGEEDAVIGKQIYVTVKDVQYNTSAEGHYSAIEYGGLDSTVKVDKNGTTYEQQQSTDRSKTFKVDVAPSSSTTEGEEEYGCNLSFSVTKNSGVYTPLWGFSPVVKDNGDFAIDDTGSYEFDKTFNSDTVSGGTLSWSDSFDLYSLSCDYYIVCTDSIRANHKLTVTPQLNDAKKTVLSDIVSTVSASSSPNTNYITAGDTVTVSMHATGSQQYTLYNWNLTGIEASQITYVNEEKTELTFTMPDSDVDLTAIYYVASEAEPSLTVKGGWDSNEYYGYLPPDDWATYDGKNYTTNETLGAFATKTYFAHAKSTTSETATTSSLVDESITTTSDSSVSNSVSSSSSSTASTSNSSDPHCYFLVASEYEKDSKGNYLKFDHWEVTQADGVAYLGADFGRKVSLVDNKPVYGDIYNLNGCTDLHICIDGTLIAQSVAVKPVYAPAEYTYSVTLSDGSVTTGTAAKGEKVEVENSAIPEGCTHEEWDITKYVINDTCYSKDNYGFISLNSSKAEEQKTVSLDDDLTFEMPEGNVVVKAVNKQGQFALTLTDPKVGGSNTIKSVQINGEDASESDLTQVLVGSKVKINFNSTEGFHYENASGLDGITLKKTYGTGDSLTSIEFTMPGKSLDVSFSYLPNNYTLNFSKAVAKDSTNKTISSGATVEYGSKILFEAEPAPAGMEFSHWNVESTGKAGQVSYQDASGNHVLLLTMPSSDATVTPVYKEAKQYEKISSIKLGLVDDSLIDGAPLPTKVTSTSAGLDTTAFEVEWYDENDNEATTVDLKKSKTYRAKIKLLAKDDYKFDSELSGTIDGLTAEVSNLGERVAWLERVYVAQSEELKDKYIVVARNSDMARVHSQICDVGEAIKITANTPSSGETFVGFTLKPAGLEKVIPISEGASKLNFNMPDSNVYLLANYTVDAVNVTLSAPVAGQPLSTAIALASGTSRQLEDDNITLFYMDEDGNQVDPSTIADYDTEYTILVAANLVETVDGQEVPIKGYTFNDECTASVNGDTATIISDENVSVLMYTFAATEKEIFDVTFDVQGIGTAPEAQAIVDGDMVIKPDDPTAEEYTFGGWFKDPACTEQWVFETDTVTSDTVLYAKWTKPESATPVPDDSGTSSASTSEESSTLAKTSDFTQWTFAGFLVVAIVAGGVVLFLRRKQHS